MPSYYATRKVDNGTVVKYYYFNGPSTPLRMRIAVNRGVTRSYLASDHPSAALRTGLGSTSVWTDQNGTEGGNQQYYAYGANRAGSGDTPTDYQFTGQRRDFSSNLYQMGVRWYDPYLNRWVQPDNIVAGPYNPQSLNRFSYVGNNPLRYTDPDGRCWPACTAAIGAIVGGVIGAGSVALPQMIQNYQKGQPLTANLDPAKVADATIKGALLGGAVGAAAGLVLPAAGAGTVAVTGTGVTSAAATAACADGDCTNEAVAVGQVVAPPTGQVAQSVWRFNPFQRGVAIENILGRSPQLTQSFPVIDRFENGLATSIKSIDLKAPSYQDIGTLTSTVRGYVNTLGQWQGASWGGVTIQASDITGRKLLLAIPPDAAPEQLEALRRLAEWAETIGVTLETAVVP